MTGRVSSYELLESFLVSGPSTFYRARSAVLGNLVILRRVALDPARADDARATFFREMRHAAGLQIPGMTRILDAFEADGALWSVQENRIGAQSERIVLDRGPVPLVEAARWGGEVADVLAHLHARGYVSGRVGPRWVLVDEQGAVLVAWTKSADLAAGIWPLRPAVAAWSAFTAPEELAGARTTPEADLYSLAATITWWLTGQYPAGGATPEEALERARTGAGAPPPLRVLRPDVPEILVSTLEGALARDPARRRGSVASLGTVLHETRLRLLAEVPTGFSTGARLRLLGTGEEVELVARHGAGAFGIVFRAKTLPSGREVAVKALKPEHREDAQARERFVRESQALQGIDHPNVIRMHGIGEERGTPYAVMDFVAGPDLGTLLLREGALPPPRAVRLAAGIARGLAAIHAEGIVHRDMKPHNVLVAGGDRPVIADFGIARTLANDRMTMTGVLVGTPAYMAPEQLEGVAPGFGMDLYALGAILHELLTGRPIFAGRDPISTMRAIREDPPPPLPAEVPSPLTGIVGRLLAKDPTKRPGDATGVADELEAMICSLDHTCAEQPFLA